MANFTEITIGERQFQVSRLKVKDSLRGLKMVGKVLLPALAEAHAAPAGQLGGALEKVIEGLDCLPELLDLFAASAKVQMTAGASFMALAPAVDDAFGGHPDQVVEFLVACVKLEYSSFLSGNGPLKGLLGQMVAKAA